MFQGASRPPNQAGQQGCWYLPGSGGLDALEGSHCAMKKSQPRALQLEHQHLLDSIKAVPGARSLRNGGPKRTGNGLSHLLSWRLGPQEAAS